MNSEAYFPVIIHEDLRLLGQFFGKMEQVKLRFSTTILKGSCIFPKASIAFLLLNESESIEEKCLERIQDFIRIHRKAFIISIVDPISGNQLQLISSIQKRILPNAYYILLAENMCEAVKVMISTAEAHSLSTVAKLNESMMSFFNASASEDVVINILVSLGLNRQESALALDVCGGLGNILTLSAEQMKEFGLDDMTARKLAEFSQKDTYSSTLGSCGGVDRIF